MWGGGELKAVGWGGELRGVRCGEGGELRGVRCGEGVS